MTTDKYTVYSYTVYRGGARILVRGGNIGQNFTHEFLSSPVLQWRRQNFGWGEKIQQKCTHQRLLNFEKFIKNLHKNLKQFSKILQK